MLALFDDAPPVRCGLAAGEHGFVALAQTPFYLEAGGHLANAASVLLIAPPPVRRRARDGGDHRTIIRLVAVSAAIVIAVALLNEDRGVPLAALIVVVLPACSRGSPSAPATAATSSPSAATTRRRAAPGSASTKIKLSVFTLASTLAAAGGILAASRLLAVNQQSGSGDVLLLAIAGPVIAGTSLFGGRGYDLVGAAGRDRDRLDLQRHGPARARLRRQVHDHRRRAAGAVTIDAVTRRRRQAARLTRACGATAVCGRVPNVREYADPALLAELGRAAETAGWDGFFVWDHIAYHEPETPVADPWVAIAALAATSARIRLGVMRLRARPPATVEGRSRNRLARPALRRPPGLRRRARIGAASASSRTSARTRTRGTGRELPR